MKFKTSTISDLTLTCASEAMGQPLALADAIVPQSYMEENCVGCGVQKSCNIGGVSFAYILLRSWWWWWWWWWCGEVAVNCSKLSWSPVNPSQQDIHHHVESIWKERLDSVLKLDIEPTYASLTLHGRFSFGCWRLKMLGIHLQALCSQTA